MDPNQAQIVMETLAEIKAKIQDLTLQAQDQAHAKEQDHGKPQETGFSNVASEADLTEFEAWTRGKPEGNSKKTLRVFPARNDLEEKARNLIRELQKSNDEQGEKILNLQMLLAELQAQQCPRGIIRVPETPILGSQVSEKANNPNDSDSELHETPILTPLTPISREAARIRILSDPSVPSSDLSTQADQTLDRISQLLAPTGTLARASVDLVTQETRFLGSQTQNNSGLDTETQDALQAKVVSLEETLHSKTRQITNMEQNHEETVRMITEQLDNAYSRLNPTSSDSPDSTDSQREALDEAYKELNKVMQQNNEESASIQSVLAEYIKQLENEVKELRGGRFEVLRLEKELRDREGPDMEMKDQLRNYRGYIEKCVPESMIKENDELHEKFKSLKVEMKTVRDELKEALDLKLSSQDRVRLEHLALREDLPAYQKSEKYFEKASQDIF